MWNDSQKPAGASRVLWLAPCFTSEPQWKRKAGGEKSQKNVFSIFSFHFYSSVGSVLCCFLLSGFIKKKKKKKVIPCWDCVYRLKSFSIFTYASKLFIFSPWQLSFQSPLPLKWFLISEVLQMEAAWDGILTILPLHFLGGFTRDIKKRMVKNWRNIGGGILIFSPSGWSYKNTGCYMDSGCCNTKAASQRFTFKFITLAFCHEM